MNARLPESLATAFLPAAQRLEAMGGIATQILADIQVAQANDQDCKTLDPLGFNDDDLYVYDDFSRRFVRRIGCKSTEYRFPQLKAGEVCTHGLRAKNLGLWVYRSAVGG